MTRLRTLRDARERTVWRPQYTRDNIVLAELHGPGCDACTAYARALADARREFRGWSGRLVVGWPMDDTDAGPGHWVDAVEVPRAVEQPRVVVADRFGDVYHTATGTADDPHALPGPRELEEWLRFLATQCPE